MIQRRIKYPILMLAAVLLVSAGARAEKGRTGPRTTYEKAAESTTGGGDASANSCLAAGEAGDGKAVVATFKRYSRRAEELYRKIAELASEHNHRQAQLAELDRQLAEAGDTERAIAASQPKSPQLGEVRAIQAALRKQKEELGAYDRSQAASQEKLQAAAQEAERCAQAIATNHPEMRQGALEERRGTVEWRRADGSADWRAATDEVVLRPGDFIRTGADGHVQLRLPDGSLMELGAQTEFMLSRDSSEYAELLVGKLRCWIMKYSRKFEVRTPTAVLAVRGTEFALEASSGAATRLTAIDGKVEFTALPGAAEAARASAWWASKSPSAASVTPKENDLIKSGESTIELTLAGGISATLAPGSVLQVSKDKEGRPLYGLWRGRLYARRAPAAGSEAAAEPVFTSPTAVCAVRGTEFEYHVPEGKAPEFTIYDGTIEVTADQKRLTDPELFRAWWEE